MIMNSSTRTPGIIYTMPFYAPSLQLRSLPPLGGRVLVSRLPCQCDTQKRGHGSFDTGRSKAPSLFAKLASLEELTAWLPRVFLDTTLPGRSKKPPYKIRPPNNLVAFFGLLAHLYCVGFPAHWLSDFPKGIVSGSMITDIEGIL